MTVKLIETSKGVAPADSAKGIYDVTLITAGQGSSGYYSEDVLEANAGVFKAGMPSFFNHLSEGQEPHERDVTKLAGKLVEDARWVKEESALKARVQFRKEHLEFIDTFKDVIGMSIFASGTASEGEVDGRKTYIVESFEESPYNSVDVVVAAGRGGKINHMVESYIAQEATANDRARQLRDLVSKNDSDNEWSYIEDYDDSVVWYSKNGATYQQSYSTIDDVANELVGEAVKVNAKTVYVPAIENSRTERAEAEDEGFHMDKDVAEAFEGLKETLVALANRIPEPVEPQTSEVDIASVVESAVEAGLSKTARTRVVEAVRAGADSESAIAAEKALRDEYEAEFKARESAGGGEGHVQTEGAKPVSANDLPWLQA